MIFLLKFGDVITITIINRSKFLGWWRDFSYIENQFKVVGSTKIGHVTIKFWWDSKKCLLPWEV